NVQRVAAGGVHFGHSPGQGVLADAACQSGTALRHKLFGLVEPHDAPLGVENNGAGDHRAEERAAAGFIEACDACPAEFARRSLETGRAETDHFSERILARCTRGESSTSIRTGLRGEAKGPQTDLNFCGLCAALAKRYS